MRIQDLAERLGKVRQVGSSWQARCPAHEDRVASLSFCEGDKGLLLFCHAGCSIEAVMDALGLAWRDIFYDDPERVRPPSIVARYPYPDEEGTVLYEVVRKLPKAFFQRLPDGSTELGDVRRVPFRLPQMMNASSVWVVEGEKDVLAVQHAGQTATCFAGAKWRPEYAQHFQGKLVSIVADQDAAGWRLAKTLHEALSVVALKCRVLRPLKGKDAYDHLAAGLALKEFQSVCVDDMCSQCGWWKEGTWICT